MLKKPIVWKPRTGPQQLAYKGRIARGEFDDGGRKFRAKAKDMNGKRSFPRSPGRCRFREAGAGGGDPERGRGDKSGCESGLWAGDLGRYVIGGETHLLAMRRDESEGDEWINQISEAPRSTGKPARARNGRGNDERDRTRRSPRAGLWVRWRECIPGK